MKITVASASKIFRKWVKRLNADSRIKVNVRVYHTEHETPEDFRDAVAAIAIEPGYFMGELLVNAWKIETPRELDEALAHEATHLVLWPLWVIARAALGDEQDNAGRDILEAAVEQVTHALLSK